MANKGPEIIEETAYAGLAELGEASSPFESFKNLGSSVLDLLFIAVIGLPFAMLRAGLVLDVYILLIVPAGIMAFLSMLTTPLLRLFWQAEEYAPQWLRAIYDFIALLTVGLPYALFWFWEGKIIGSGLILIGSLSLTNAAAGIAFLITTVVGASFIYTIIGRFMPIMGGGVLTTFEKVMRAIDLTFSIWVSYILNVGMYYFIMPSAIAAVAPVSGFLLSIISIDSFKNAVPKTGNTRLRVPITWNIVALLIGLSALAGTYFWVYMVAAVAIYLFMLYVISGNVMWAWYALIAMPMSVPTAYYLGYLTGWLIKLGAPVTVMISMALPSAFLFTMFIVIIFISLLIVYYGLKIGGLWGGIAAGVLAFILFMVFIAVLNAVAGTIDLAAELSQAINYLVSPA
jgi:hypothetical protein